MSRTGSFKATGDLLRGRIQAAGEARGFAATRLLTHWAEIVGEDTARLARPKDIRFARPRAGATKADAARGAGGRAKAVPEGATLVLEVMGPAALRLEMEKERIRERVNAVYGYAAIAAIKLVQVGPLGFTKPSAAFAADPAPAGPSPEVLARVAPLTEGIGDTELRLALAALAANVLGKSRT